MPSNGIDGTTRLSAPSRQRSRGGAAAPRPLNFSPARPTCRYHFCFVSHSEHVHPAQQFPLAPACRTSRQRCGGRGGPVQRLEARQVHHVSTSVSREPARPVQHHERRPYQATLGSEKKKKKREKKKKTEPQQPKHPQFNSIHPPRQSVAASRSFRDPASISQRSHMTTCSLSAQPNNSPRLLSSQALPAHKQ